MSQDKRRSQNTGSGTQRRHAATHHRTTVEPALVETPATSYFIRRKD
jgi:hypothetical protein